jgi:dsRNA-specific ribonuclease
MLQEFIQKKYKLIPQYIDYEQEIDEKWNPILYKAEVYVKEEKIGEWSGTNKKKAEIAAAKDALKNLGVL